VLDLHRELLSDTARVGAFRDALRKRVRAGDVVIDLASGTGVLGFLACEAGARRVYAIESSGIVDVARRVAQANGFGDRVSVRQTLAADAELPELADGVVADQIGHFGFEAGLFQMFERARTWLKPGGWIVPEQIDFMLAPVTDADIRSRLESWNGRPGGLDFSSARPVAVNAVYPKLLEAEQLLGPAAVAFHVRLAEISSRLLSARVCLRIERDGILDGLGGWFRAELATGVFMTNAPGAAPRLMRRNVVLPIEVPRPVASGDLIELRLRMLPAEGILDWRGVVQTRRGTFPFAQSTVHGLLFSREDLDRTKPAHAPRLTERGRARKTVLELCDGRRPVADIERAVRERHRTLFRTPAEAAAFVAEVISRNAE
jgi:protein arginine N-methyltransferase 1